MTYFTPQRSEPAVDLGTNAAIKVNKAVECPRVTHIYLFFIGEDNARLEVNPLSQGLLSEPPSPDISQGLELGRHFPTVGCAGGSLSKTNKLSGVKVNKNIHALVSAEKIPSSDFFNYKVVQQGQCCILQLIFTVPDLFSFICVAECIHI